MKIIVGDEFGLIKCIDTEKKLVLGKYGEIGKKNGVLGIGGLFGNYTNYGNYSNAINKSILAITHEQNFYILDWNSMTIKSQPEIKAKTVYTSQVVKHTIDFSSVICSRNDNKIDIFRYDEEVNLTSHNEVDIKTQKMQQIKDASSSQEIFVLFKDTPVSVYDLEKTEFSWRAKNVPNDEFNLKVPIWDVDVAQRSSGNIFYTATAFGEIRVYDKKAQLKPITDKKVFDRKINRMVLSNCENYLTIGDTVGNVQMLDKRKNLTIAKNLKGSTGAIRDIVHIKGKSNDGLTLVCGLDRFLRVFDYRTNADLPQIYLKNKLNVIYPYEVQFNDNDNENENENEDEQGFNEDESDDLMEEGEFTEEDDDLEEAEEDEISELSDDLSEPSEPSVKIKNNKRK